MGWWAEFQQRLKRKVKYRRFLFIGPGTGTQCALRGHTGKLRQGVGRERGALSKGWKKSPWIQYFAVPRLRLVGYFKLKRVAFW